MATDEQAKLNRIKIPDIGDLLDDRYRIQSLMATGGMGVILRAEQLPMKRPVALKLLHPHIATSDPKVVGRLQQEVRLAKLLNHPNTIRLYDFGESREGLIYVAMEYLEGVDIKQLLAEEGALPAGRALEITRQMLDGLAEAHSHDFIHRDLKPSNVFITKNRRGEDFVKLLDFGIAKSLDGSDVDLTASGSICGTPGYVAPEYLKSETLVKASDVYAVGLMLLEMLTGERVFQGEAAVQTMMMHLQIDPDIPPAIERTPIADIVRKATAKDPAERYVDADVMLKALEAIIDEVPTDLRLEDYEYPSEQKVAHDASTPPPKVTGRLAAESSVSEFNEDSRASGTEQATSQEVTWGAAETGWSQRRVGTIVGGLAALLLLAIVAVVIADPGSLSQNDGSENAAVVDKEHTETTATSSTSRPVPSETSKVDAGAKVTTLRFDLDTDPSGATARIEQRKLGTTPLVYEVDPSELPQQVTFEMEGHREAKRMLTSKGVPLVVEVLTKAPVSHRPSKARRDQGGRLSARGASGAKQAKQEEQKTPHKAPQQDEKGGKELSDDNVEKVLDELLVE
jgi:serine/threonine-protein kinase